MELNKKKIYERISNKKFNIDKNNLIELINNTFKLTKNIISKYIFEKPLNNLKHNMNPLLWEYGHFLFFWEYLIVRNLYNYDYIPILEKNYYDSFLISKDNRYYYYDKLANLEELNLLFVKIQKIILENINKNDNIINKYLIYLGCSHQHMHNESFIFTMNNLNLNYKFTNNYNYNEKIITDINFIDIKSDNFIQGVDKNCKTFYFDNEYPSFNVNINAFSVSKYCITNYQYLKFVKDGGYKNKELFTPEGYRYIQKNNLQMPYSWEYIDGEYYENIFGQKIKLRYNHPVNVTWYETKAYCNFYGFKMITESEWEYLADNNINSICNYTEPKSVNEEKNVNRFGVYGLYGNYWEWCEDSIYPYDGFVIDPVYREMSYPFFGYKKICRGGAWCVPEFLATRTYRNAQLPDCYYQFITFRVKK
jgi:formylglycine-generating enzyme required for sulfatase activity